MSDDSRITSIGPKRDWITTDLETKDGYWALVVAVEAVGNDGQMYGLMGLLAEDACAEGIESARRGLEVGLFNQMWADGVWEIDAAPAQSP